MRPSLAAAAQRRGGALSHAPAPLSSLAVIKRVPQQFCLTYPSVCSNTACTNRTKWQSLLDQGTFVDWQKVRVQESPDEVPPGSLPRTLDVILRNASVEKARAGDKCLFTGTLLAVPDINMIAPPGECGGDAGPRLHGADVAGDDSGVRVRVQASA